MANPAVRAIGAIKRTAGIAVGADVCINASPFTTIRSASPNVPAAAAAFRLNNYSWPGSYPYSKVRGRGWERRASKHCCRDDNREKSIAHRNLPSLWNQVITWSGMEPNSHRWSIITMPAPKI
jgi:hypothetical protein